jgi:GNAT superfamily N-acetyltransferase
MTHEWQRDPYIISTDKNKLDLEVIHGFLTRSYWSEGISIARVSKAIENSLCFGLYKGDEQIGFTRVVTDYVSFAYIADVFVLEPYRGLGLSVWMMETVMAHPELQGFRLWTLRTKDAHGLYRKVGFTAPTVPERLMERFSPDIYKNAAQAVSE